MRTAELRSIAVLAFTLAGASAAAGQKPRLTLQGTVIDSATGAPVVGAIVELARGRKVLTDSAGRFTFPNLAPGPHTLTAFSLGYRAVTRALQPGETGAPVLVLPPDPVLLAAIRVAVDSLEARRLGCACWKRLQQIVFGPSALYVSREPNLRRFLDSLSYVRGPYQMTYRFAANPQAAAWTFGQPAGGRSGWRPSGPTPGMWFSWWVPFAGNYAGGAGGFRAPAIFLNEMGTSGWTLDALRPDEIARMELYRERGSPFVTIRLYTASFLLHMVQTNRGLDWICSRCGSGERRGGRAR